MKTPKSRFALFLFCALVLASPALAQMAESVPTSDNLVTFKIQLPPGHNDEQPVKITVREGGMARVELDHGRKVFGFTPHLVEGTSEHLVIHVFEIEERARDKEAVRLVETLDARAGIATALRKAAVPPGVQLVVSDIKLKPSEE